MHAILGSFLFCCCLLCCSQVAYAAESSPAPDPDVEQAEREKRQGLPPLPELEPWPAPRWQRRIEIGGDFVYLSRPFSQALQPSRTHYPAAPGFGVHLRWRVWSWLRFQPYFFRVVHDVQLPPGSLQSGTDKSIRPDASYAPLSVETFVFGARLAPTYELSPRARAWLSIGVGWGRFQFDPQTITNGGNNTFEVGRRSGVFAEIPVGLGIAYDIVPRWLALSYEAVFAPALGQSGLAHEVVPAVDADGATRDVGPLGATEGSFVQTVGLSLIL